MKVKGKHLSLRCSRQFLQPARPRSRGFMPLKRRFRPSSKR